MEPVELLRQLLQVRSINPSGDHHTVAQLAAAYLADAGLRTKVLTSPAGHANLVARVEGPTDRPALVLLSHSDVVPVEEQRWSRDPFGAELVDGFVWGRGALDMKSITVMHAVAAAGLAASGVTPDREIIVALVGDEEAGGDEGARWLLEEHPELVGFGDRRPAPEVIGEGAYGIDAGLSRPVLPVALGEKTALWFDVVTTGDSGHGALPPTQQAIRNLTATLDQIAGFGTPRLHPVIREQFATLATAASGPTAAIFRGLASPAGPVLVRAVAARLREAGTLGLLLSDSITPTTIAAGYKSNVVPGEAKASFDARLLPDTDIPDFVASRQQQADKRGGHVTNVTHKGHGPVSGKGPLFDILHAASTQVAEAALPTVSLSPGITDLRFFRARGAAAYGWTPLVLTPELLATIHGHDERIPVDGFEHAVTIMSDVVHNAASCSSTPTHRRAAPIVRANTESTSTARISTMKHTAAPLTRGRRLAIRVVGAIGVLLFAFFSIVALNVLGVVASGTEGAPDDPAPSVEARYGAAHPGEAVHAVGAVALVAIGASALLALLVRPERAGYAYQVLAVMTGVLLTIPIVGDPDSVGGQAGPIDPFLLVLTLPAIVAALLAAPWRRLEGPWRPRVLMLAAVGAVPAAWYGIDQALLQRNTFPPTADPHHNAHWWVMAIIAFTAVLLMAAAALPGRVWRLGASLAAVAAIGVGLASLTAGSSASALVPLGAITAIGWGLVGLWLSLHDAAVRGAAAPESLLR